MGKRKIIIAAGGTGGHLFPAQGFAKELQQKEQAEVLFVGGGLSKNPYFRKELFLFQEVESATPFKGNIFRSLGKLIKGTFQSFRVLGDFRPDLLVGFGSFHSFPVLLAALCKKIPIVLFEANAYPGKVNRFFSRWAKYSCVQFAESKKYLKGDVREVAMPLWIREEEKLYTQAEACSYFGLQPGRPTVLVFGGSQGAVSINRIFEEVASPEVQVIHLAGKEARIDVLRDVYARKGVSACVKSFEDKMSMAWRAAHFAICRAGAATLSEAIAFEVPMILIPYPYAADDHQKKNAQFVEKKIGAAIVLEETQLSKESLAHAMEKMLTGGTLEKMRENIRYAKIDLLRNSRI